MINIPSSFFLAFLIMSVFRNMSIMKYHFAHISLFFFASLQVTESNVWELNSANSIVNASHHIWRIEYSAREDEYNLQSMRYLSSIALHWFEIPNWILDPASCQMIFFLVMNSFSFYQRTMGRQLHCYEGSSLFAYD